MCTLEINGSMFTKGTVKHMIFTVIDDGVGFDLTAVPKKSSKGVSNVRERLAISYKNASFDVQSKPLYGTKVVIEIQQEEKEYESFNC
jgi:signal transduction histidine kinase